MQEGKISGACIKLYEYDEYDGNKNGRALEQETRQRRIQAEKEIEIEKI